MPYLTSYLCVCVFVGFLLNLALAELGGGREGAGSRRAERLSQAERGGPGGQGGPLTTEGAGELGSWGRRQPRLRCHPTGIRGEAVQGCGATRQGSEGKRSRAAAGEPQAHSCHRKTRPPWPLWVSRLSQLQPQVPDQSPALAKLSARAGDPRQPLARRRRERPELTAAPEPATGQAWKRPVSLASSFSFGWFLLLKTKPLAPNQNV